MGLISWIGKFFKDETGVRNDISAPASIDKILEMIASDYAGSESGVVVSAERAIRQATVYSCVRIISGTISQLPLHLYQRTTESRNRAESHWLYDLLRNQPNDYMTASEFWQFMAAGVVMRGRACAYKVRIGNRTKELIPIAPNCIDEDWKPDNTRTFRIQFANGTYAEVDPEDVFCIRGLTLDGRSPISPIKYMANSIGLSIATTAYNSKFFKNGARPSGVLKHPNVLKEEIVEKLRESWQQQHGGENSGKIAILSGGLDYLPISMTNEDAQLLELMGFNRTEICGIFGVPPHMVGAIEKTSSWGTGLAEQVLSFIKFTIGPWLVRIEQSVSRDLLSKPERRQYYPEFLTEQFLRSATKDRFESYKAALGGTQHPGFMAVNEVRSLENLSPLPGGDELYRPQPSKGRAEENAQTAEQNQA